ncbi:NUDIX domain-containing protein [Streptomyces sp. WAC01526]|uniref:NUDIX domain-containing protein n=1 Tax=Streptomyces sp. WAC01526 TaxID=2588709 RepID=UPI00165239FE|nr:NUDIX domain-containing protein [Streptomyces sp. WAC01526]
MTEPATPEIRTSAKAVILHEGQVLLMRANWDDQECYFLPGGGQHPGESLGDAVRREVDEETGLTITVERLLWLREYIGANHDRPVLEAKTHRIEAIFLCTPTSDPHQLGGHAQDDAQTGLEWVPLGKVPDLNLLPHAIRQPIADLAETRPAPDSYLGDVA